MSHECVKEEFLGRVAEFMQNTKGLKATIFTIALAILIQVGAFLVMWGSLTTTVKVHDKAIDMLCNKLDKVKIVGYAIAGEKGE